MRGAGGGGESGPRPPYLQPTPGQVQLHRVQLRLRVTPLALHLLQVASIGLQGVQCAHSILATTVPREQVRTQQPSTETEEPQGIGGQARAPSLPMLALVPQHRG